MNIKRKPISETSDFIPFGAFNSDSSAKGPANEVYVGHENERAQFIRRLLNSGRSGAYIITGNRGTGKTSFTNYCLDEYEKYTFHRFLRTSIGKSFWDIALIIFGAFILLSVPGFLTELYVESSDHKITSVAFTLPLIIICYIIWQFATEQGRLILHHLFAFKNGNEQSLITFLWKIAFIFLGLGFTYLSLILSTNLVVSWVFFTGCYGYLILNWFWSLKAASHLKEQRILNVWPAWFFVFISLSCLFFFSWLLKSCFVGSINPLDSANYTLFAISLIFVAAGIIFRQINRVILCVEKIESVKQAKDLNLIAKKENNKDKDKDKDKDRESDPMSESLKSLFFPILLLSIYGLVYYVTATFCQETKNLILAALSATLGGLLSLCRKHWIKQVWTHDKALLFLVCSQLLVVFLVWLFYWVEVGFGDVAFIVIIFCLPIGMGVSWLITRLPEKEPEKTPDNAQETASEKTKNKNEKEQPYLADQYLFIRENFLALLKGSVFLSIVLGFSLPVLFGWIGEAKHQANFHYINKEVGRLSDLVCGKYNDYLKDTDKNSVFLKLEVDNKNTFALVCSDGSSITFLLKHSSKDEVEMSANLSKSIGEAFTRIKHLCRDENQGMCSQFNVTDKEHNLSDSEKVIYQIKRNKLEDSNKNSNAEQRSDSNESAKENTDSSRSMEIVDKLTEGPSAPDKSETDKQGDINIETKWWTPGIIAVDPPSSHWYILIISLLLLIVFLEYEWLINPGRIVVEESSLRRKVLGHHFEIPTCFFIHKTDDSENHLKTRAKLKKRYCQMIDASIVNLIFRFWLPVIRIKVNLGFDDVSHAQVIQTILRELRETYYQKFISLKSPRALFLNLIGFCGILFLTSHLSGALLDIAVPEDIDSKIIRALKTNSNSTANINKAPENEEPITTPLFTYLFDLELYAVDDNHQQNRCIGRQEECITLDKHDVSNKLLFYMLYFPLIEVELTHGFGDKNVISDFYMEKGIFPFKDFSHLRTDKIQPVYAIRVYHAIMFVLIYLLFWWFNRRTSIIPYKSNEKRIGHVISSMTSTNIDDSNPLVTSKWAMMQFNLGSRKQVVTYPSDSRTVEQQFLNILRNIGTERLELSRNNYHLPTPDITIIFDELDKLGTRYDPEEAENDPKTRDSINSSEVKRSLKIRSLLSDFKHILTSDACRFIFIGGRHLSDEWYSDLSQKDQLLPSVFDKAIYLQSLLTDFDKSDDQTPYLLQRVMQFVAQQKYRAEHVYRDLIAKEEASFLFSTLFIKSRNTFASSEMARIDAEEVFVKGNYTMYRGRGYRYSDAGHVVEASSMTTPEAKLLFINQFAKFLAYRTHGIPKRINEIFSSFIIPLGRALEHDQNEDKDFGTIKQQKNLPLNCNDVLYFSDIDYLRIQLIAELYDEIDDVLSEKLKNRDDKLVTSMFYLADFLFKFHQRAFTWDSLEKIDDLADINRAPDLRKMLGDLVDACSALLFHRVLNGMYAFRFKSNVAREIVYISRSSPMDEAAFNFTKDESQSLKELYVKKLQDGKFGNPDLISALGELYEFDQDYDAARKEYYRAIDAYDKKLEEYAGSFSIEKGQRPTNVPHIFSSRNIELARQSASWSVARLRLTLQIGMTYELSMDYERAQMLYHEAHVYAHSLIEAFSRETKELHPSDELSQFYLKHFNLLYQPVFAKAWVAEKDPGSVDTSVAIVEEELNYVEQKLPFNLRNFSNENFGDISPTKIQHSNYALLKAELHDKQGDLLFFKGCQLPLTHWERHLYSDKNKNEDNNSKDKDAVAAYNPQWAGYLIHAGYHYVLGLHYLRLFNLYRRQSSGSKFNLFFGERTFGREMPDFPLMSISSTLADLSEAILPRVYFEELFKDIEKYNPQDNSKRHSQISDMKNLSDHLKDDVINIVDTTRYWLTSRIHKDKSDEHSELEELERIHAGIKSAWRMAFIKRWFGEVSRPDTSNKKRAWQYAKNCIYGIEVRQQRLLDTSDKPSSALEKLCCYFAFNHLSAVYLKDAGFIADSANEFLRGAETINHLIEKLYIDYGPITKEDVRAKSELMVFLVKRALYRLERALDFFVNDSDKLNFCEDKQPDVSENFLSLVPKRFVVTLITLYVNTLRHDDNYFSVFTESQIHKGDSTLRRVLYHLFNTSLGGEEEHKANDCVEIGKDLILNHENVGEYIKNQMLPADDDCKRPTAKIAIVSAFNKVLDRYLIINRYPILNRLNGLRTLVTCSLILNDLDEAKARAKELIALSNRYDSPFHFMPINIAVVCYEVSSKLWKVSIGAFDAWKKLQSESEQLHHKVDFERANEVVEWDRAALKYALESQQMYTQKQGYYDSVASFHYLYDDFNDRHIHHGHAIQMFWASTSQCISQVIKERLKRSSNAIRTCGEDV